MGKCPPKSIFDGKKILFYGPANTLDKKHLNVNSFDYVIITNKMVELFFSKFTENLSCKVILLANQLFSLKHADRIKKYTDKIEVIFSVGRGYSFLKENLQNVKICSVENAIPQIKGVPLGLSRILKILEPLPFQHFHITGVTFYSEGTISKCYENDYITEEGKIYNVFNQDKGLHDIPSNISYTKQVCQTHKNISVSKELQEILHNFEKSGKKTK